MAEIIGLDKLEIKLEHLGNLNLKDTLSKAGVLVMDAAKEKCPVDTGTLRNSITYEVEGNTCEIGTNMSYAPYVEFGTGLYAVNGDGRQTSWKYKTDDGAWHTTKGQKAQPFLQPSLLENKATILNMFNEGVKEEVK